MSFLLVEHMGVPTMSQHQGSWVTLKAHFVVSPFGMWQKEDKMKNESTQIMDCSTFFSLFLNIFSVVVEHIFLFSPLFGEDSLQPESHELFHLFFRCFLNQL